MAAGISRPDVWYGYAPNRDPNDPSVPPAWVALESSTFQVRSVSGLVEGRDYELAQPMAADPTMLVRDVNEYLNPDNPSSPYAGQILPYREVASICQWPITASGGNNNLINSGTWRGSRVDAFDPSFDSYVLGAAAPNWLDRYGVVLPTISNAGPFQGTQHVRYTVAGTTASQGVGFGTPVFPGRQYTTSAYVKQGTASTQQIYAEGLLAVADQFRRNVSNGIGTPDAAYTAGPYTTAGGAASDYSVVFGTAIQTQTSVGVNRIALAPGSFHDSEQTVTMTLSALATGDVYREGLVSRYVDGNNFYFVSLYAFMDRTLQLLVERTLAGVTTTLATIALPLTYAAGSSFRLSFTTSGTSLSVHVWPVGANESLTWSTTVTDASAALNDTGSIGFHSARFASNTNTNLACAFSNYGAFGSIGGTSTVTTGAYVRLSVTWTANQLGRSALVDTSPLGRAPQGVAVVVRTRGTAVAGTVDVDAIQHEQSAAVSTFSTSGPVIYPIFRNFAERYPRAWSARGSEGIVAIPCVDAFALLNKISVADAADQAIIDAGPDYFYALDGGADTTAYPDTSGYGRPALVPFASKYGAQPGSPAGGGSIGVPGDPVGTAVTFERDYSASLTQGTILATGTIVKTTPVAIPPVPSVPFEFTVVGWVRLTDDTHGSQSVCRTIGRGGRTALLCGTGGVTFSYGTIFSVPTIVAAGTALDGNVHFVAGTVVMDATNCTFTAWLDGVSNSSTVTTASLGGIPTVSADSIEIGGAFMDYPVPSYGTVANGQIGKIGIWNRKLSNAEIAAIYAAGSTGTSGELSGARILRHLRSGPYNGPTRVATGSTVMGIPSFSQLDLFNDSLNTMQAEQGTLWVQPDGVLAFEGRQERWLRLASLYTFGENEAGGEIPYQDGVIFDNDPTYVYPIVTWARNGGSTAYGGLPDTRAQAQARFFPRQFDGSSDLASDATAQYLADWIFYSHRAPMTRVDTLIVKPWAAPTLWGKCLSLQPGQRVTVIRRAKAANAGAGLTMSASYFIEKIGKPEINYAFGQESWDFEIQLSPIGATNAPAGPTMQPWILEDATYGVLDSTTVLGF
jgi:hypothetical protein